VATSWNSVEWVVSAGAYSRDQRYDVLE